MEETKVEKMVHNEPVVTTNVAYLRARDGDSQ